MLADKSMSEQFLNSIPEDTQVLSPDARAILRAIHAFEHRTREREESHCAQTVEQIEQLTQTQHELQRSIEQIAAGFPDGNPDGHRRYHESVIKRQELRNELLRKTFINVATYGGIGLIGWFAYAILTALKTEITK